MLGRRGQYIVEYAILIGIVAIALSGMSLYLRRAVQGATKLVDDEFSEGGESWNRAQGYALGTAARVPGGTGVVAPQRATYSNRAYSNEETNSQRTVQNQENQEQGGETQ